MNPVVLERMVHFLTLERLKFCRYCERWRTIGSFFSVGRDGCRHLRPECSRCRVHPARMGEEAAAVRTG